MIQQFLYSVLFLLNKYTGFGWTESLLGWYENEQIKRYIQQTNTVDNFEQEIPVITKEGLNLHTFSKLSNNFRNPVLIKGVFKDTPAVQNWSLDYLKNVIQDYSINVVSEQGLESGDLLEEMPFSEFAEKCAQGNVYINNNHTILNAFPELFNDLDQDFKFLVRAVNTNLTSVHIANLFIGNSCVSENQPPTGSNIHCGGSGNFFCQIVGQKEWILIDPKYSHLLKGRVSPSGIHAQSLFDMLDTRLDTIPEMLLKIPHYRVVLEPGDVLWNAPWWWHRVHNKPGFSIGMAIRNNKVTGLNFANNALYTLSGYKYLIYNSVLIELYERYILGKVKHFSSSKEEKTKGNVLYQIQYLSQKYPTSVTLEQVLEN